MSHPANPPILGHRTHGHGPNSVLLLHDWMGDADNWNAVLPYVDSETYTYILADVRGYGRSKDMRGKYTVEEVSGDLLALADHLGLQEFHLVGHSMSGMAIQRALLDHPSRIVTAALISPVIASGYPADETTKAFLWATIDDADTAQQALGALTGNRLGPSWARLRSANFMAKTDKDAVRGYYRMWLESDFSNEMGPDAPATPLLVSGGRNDLPGFDEQTYRATLGKWFPSARFEFQTDAGHYSMLETPVRIAALLEEHHAPHTKA